MLMIVMRRLAVLGVLAAVIGSIPLLQSSLGTFLESAGAATDPVAAMSQPLYQRVNPRTSVNLVTPWATEATKAATSYGFTTDLGTPFRAALKPGDGLTAVHRLYRSKNADFTWALKGSAALSSAKNGGYADQGVSFYATASALGARTQPVQSYVKNAIHRLALNSAGSSLVAQGWVLEGTAFHIPVPGSVIPTTASTPESTTSPSPSPTSPTSSPTSPSPSPTSPSPSPTASTSTPSSGSTGSGSTGLQGVGAASIGSASYPVPAGAVIVSPTGSDSGPGNEAAPLATVTRALAVVPDGGTVVLRGGTYHESLTIQGKTVTIQNYPGEAAWLDGSVPVSGWVADGGVWRKDGWTTRFDSSPTYTRGAPDGTSPGWQFVNTSTYPMAAHPDQVFVDGKALRQVQDRDQVSAGTFFLDTSTSQLYLGSNPDGHTVDASTLIKAMTIRGANSVIRGIGIRRYSPSVFHVGAVTVEAQGVRLENVALMDSATTGLSVQKPDVTLDRVTVERSGMLGIQSRYADRETFSSVLVANNNVEHFNISPNAGGVKITSTRGITVRNSSISNNLGHGFWEDMSCYDTVIRASQFNGNAGDGLFLELSAKAVIGDSLVSGNQGFGIKVNNTSNVRIWNNTLTQNGRALNLVQDSRRNTDRSDPAVDSRISWPDPEMPWTLGPVTVRNNVVADPNSSASCLLCVEDYSRTMSAEQMGVTANADVYHRPDNSSPTWLALWSRANVNVNPYTFTSLPSLASTTGQERQGREYVGSTIVDSSGDLAPSVESSASTIAEPLPSDVASAIGRPSGSRHLGKW